ncbi:hypothetical protein [Streptomyces sp. NPDC004266]|uniref:hypothetical protein n=1 Tax=Streptomyces sp. NPDC004266 TaxID=3364693 RepID=UPI00369760F3
MYRRRDWWDTGGATGGADGATEARWTSGRTEGGGGGAPCSSRSSTTPAPGSCGAVAAWARSPDCRSIPLMVRPPPTSATAVATTARRWFFLQRARWRRRAARPSTDADAPTTSAAESPPGVPSTTAPTGSPSRSRPSCHAPEEGVTGADTSPVAVVATGAGTMRPPVVVGAMSGA